MTRSILSGDACKICLSKILFTIALLVLVSCGGGGGGGGGVVSEELNPSADSFKFIVLSDIHVRIPGNPDDGAYNNAGNLSNFNNALSTIKADHADAVFVISTGDNVGCLFSHDLVDYDGSDNPAQRFKDMMDTLGKPYYAALGNHDYEDGFDKTDPLRPKGEGITSSDPAAMEAIWKKVLGIDPYYSFIYQGVRFIILNSVHGPEYNTVCPASSTEKSCKGSFYADQITWLDLELKDSSTPYCLIFLHHPVISDHNSTTTWAALKEEFQVRSGDPLYAVLQTYKSKIKGIFVGHGHLKVNDTLDGTIPVYETASIGDLSGSSGNIRIVWMDPKTGTMLTKK